MNYSSSASSVTVRDNFTGMETQLQEPNLPSFYTIRGLPYSGSIDQTISVSVTFMNNICIATGSEDQRCKLLCWLLCHLNNSFVVLCP